MVASIRVAPTVGANVRTTFGEENNIECTYELVWPLSFLPLPLAFWTFLRVSSRHYSEGDGAFQSLFTSQWLDNPYLGRMIAFSLTTGFMLQGQSTFVLWVGV